MSRVTWKFSVVTINDLQIFFKKTNPSYRVGVDSYRSKTINNWNKNRNYTIPQGKTNITVWVDDYSVGKKLGMFSKTRKPFFFRSKRRKK